MMERPDPQKSREHAACFNLRQCSHEKIAGTPKPKDQEGFNHFNQ